MQMYKVNINQTDAVYFRHQVDAQQYATKYNTQCYKVSIRPHHTAIARGFISDYNGYQQAYNGRFGQGFIWHYPSSRRKLNRHHVIGYYIEH